MIRSLAMHRRLGRWLVGLYVLAIAGGLLPLAESYRGHGAVSATAQAMRSSGTDAHRHRGDHRLVDHRLGDADDAAHHHVVQDLTGTFTSLPASCDEVPIVPVAIMWFAPRPLIAAEAIRLERPPKISVSI